MIEFALFWSCCLLALAGAIGSATVKNLFHAALLLGLSLAGVAGLYLFLEAQYLACIQVVVYIGGILVLILFATLFSADIMGLVQQPSRWLRLAAFLGAALGLVLAGRLAQVVVRHAAQMPLTRSAPGTGVEAVGSSAKPLASGLGQLFTGTWLLPFLLASLLLTVALVGAVATVRRYRRPTEAWRG